MEKRVTFNKILGIIFLVCSSFILFVSFTIGPSVSTISGFILLLVSILYLVSPAIVYDDNEIQMKNLLGMTLKRHSFEKDKITTQDRRIYVNDKKLNIAKGMLVRSEYDDLIEHILTKQIEAKNNPGKPLKGNDEILDSEMN